MICRRPLLPEQGRLFLSAAARAATSFRDTAKRKSGEINLTGAHSGVVHPPSCKCPDRYRPNPRPILRPRREPSDFRRHPPPATALLVALARQGVPKVPLPVADAACRCRRPVRWPSYFLLCGITSPESRLIKENLTSRCYFIGGFFASASLAFRSSRFFFRIAGWTK